jgi:hypothetical protein
MLAAALATEAISTRTVAAEGLAPAVPGTETIGTAARLTDRKFRNWTRRRRLSLSRQRRANQRSVDGAFFIRAIFDVLVSLNFLDDPIILRRQSHLDLGIVAVFVMIE